jgi:plasmid maintenance system antidote protein VapI
MTDQIEKLRQYVLSEVARRRLKAIEMPDEIRQMKLVGDFLKARLESLHQTEADLAEKLEIKPQVIDLLIKGEVPAWMLSDEVVVRLARHLNLETNVLRIMLGREIVARAVGDGAGS